MREEILKAYAAYKADCLGASAAYERDSFVEAVEKLLSKALVYDWTKAPIDAIFGHITWYNKMNKWCGQSDDEYRPKEKWQPKDAEIVLYWFNDVSATRIGVYKDVIGADHYAAVDSIEDVRLTPLQVQKRDDRWK